MRSLHVRIGWMYFQSRFTSPSLKGSFYRAKTPTARRERRQFGYIVLSCPPNDFLINLVTLRVLVQCCIRGFIGFTAKFVVLINNGKFLYYCFSHPTWLMPNWPWIKAALPQWTNPFVRNVGCGSLSIQLALRSFSFYAGLLWTITVSGVWDIFLLRWAELIGE